MTRPESNPRRRWERAIWVLVSLLILIGIAIVFRRATNLNPSGAAPRFPGAADLDRGFFAHPRLTLIHIIPALVFLLLGPWQFMSRLRARKLAWHRWSGRVFILAGLITGISALIMSPQMAIGGMNETAATMVFGLLFLFSLLRAYWLILHRQIALHREWMIRAFTIGLAVTTVRPIVGVFFATSRLTHLQPRDFFGTAFWLGFTISAMAAEAWINYTRTAPSRKRVSAS